jgi:hypothetical protein
VLLTLGELADPEISVEKAETIGKALQAVPRIKVTSGPESDETKQVKSHMVERSLTLRDKIFISHATSPEDNEFTRWLALQLVREGFPVWCDLIKLQGGEDFWKDIQSAIRDRGEFNL